MKFVVSVLFVLFTAAAGFAQSPSKILQRAEKALGGKALKSVRSVVKTGTIKRLSDGAEGKFTGQTSQWPLRLVPRLARRSCNLNRKGEP